MKNKQLFQRESRCIQAAEQRSCRCARSRQRQKSRRAGTSSSTLCAKASTRTGLIRILESYLGNVSSTTQPAAWVSGFYGSGKSHLLKMFRHLWVDTRFDDGSTARGLARLPQEVQDLLRELDTLGKRNGGLHAASGTLPSAAARASDWPC